MKKIVRLNESMIQKLVRKVLQEQKMKDTCSSLI